MGLSRTILIKALRGVGSVFLVMFLVFLALRLVPGDPAQLILGEQAKPSDIQKFREATHLDLSFSGQLREYMSDVLDGSLGEPYARYFDAPTVSHLIVDRLSYTIELALAAILIAMLLSFPLGILAAMRPGTWIDRLVLGFSLFGVAIPSFWLGPMLLYVFAVTLDLLPGPAEPISGIQSLILPAATLGFALSGKLVRFVRAGVLEVLSEDYIQVARAKGMHGRAFYTRHLLPGALIPVITLMGVQLASLLGGTIIVEQVFARPGIGRLLMEAIYARDYNVVQGCVITISIGYVLVHLLVDLLYAWVDPRVRVSG